MGMFQCGHCGKEFATLVDMQIHFHRHFDPGADTRITGPDVDKRQEEWLATATPLEVADSVIDSLKRERAELIEETQRLRRLLNRAEVKPAEELPKWRWGLLP